MSSVFDTAFIDAQIASLKTQLTENTTALTKAREAQSYSLDTGQTDQSVKRAELTQLQADRKAILDELAYWDAQKNGTGGTYARPGF